jgi:hypothetical protein
VIDAWDRVGVTVTPPQPVFTTAERAAAASNGSQTVELREQLVAISEQLRVTAEQLSVH